MGSIGSGPPGWGPDGELVWERPVAEVFGRDYSSDFGWSFHQRGDAYWGYLGCRPPGGVPAAGGWHLVTGPDGVRGYRL